MTYLITFTCYGQHLHGSDAGSVDRTHRGAGTPTVDADPKRVSRERERMSQAPYLLDAIRREVVLNTVRKVSAHRGWYLYAAHVRMTHVHIVVDSDAAPELVMNSFKSYASRALNELG